MKSLLLGIEFLIGIALVACVLFHSPKGEGLGAIGGQARMFSAQKGIESGLYRVTTGLAIVFMTIAALLGFFF